MTILEVFSPFDQTKIGELPFNTEVELDKMLMTAESLFTQNKSYFPPYKRIQVLEKAAQIMSERIELLTMTAAKEGGKPYRDSKVEVLRAINGVKLAIHHLHSFHGEEVPMGLTTSSVNRLALTIKEPIGVVGSISAFNHPLNLIVHQTVPAIAVGCPVIVKPALTTPYSCLAFIDILKEAGLPEEFCQVLICPNELAEKMATDSRINYLSFIGSAEVGWYLRSRVAPGTRVGLEHGGVAPVIIDELADLDMLVPLIAKGAFYHSGQVCVSVQKVFVHHHLADLFTEKLTEFTKNLVLGDPLLSSTDLGPIITHEACSRIEKWVNESKSAGGKIIIGGSQLTSSLYPPTIIYNPGDDQKVSREEIFGPVVSIYPYQDLGEAIRRANQLPFVFQSSIFTQDINRAISTAKQLNASAVMINDHTAFRVDWMPFGGHGQSGLGIGGIPHSMNEMSCKKLITFNIQSGL